MELSDYVKLLRRSSVFIITITVLFVVATVLFLLTAKPTYDANMSITTDHPTSVLQKEADYYLYDAFYRQQSSGLFADTLTNWLQTPSIVEAIYIRAGVSLPPVSNVNRLGKLFVIRKLPPASVSITIRTADQSQGVNLLNAAISELQARTDDTRLQGSEDTYTLHTTTPISTQNHPSFILCIIIAGSLGIILTTFIVFIREYIRKE